MIDYSNGYPVQVTTNVTKDTPWSEVFKKNGNPFKNWNDDGWRPSNWKNVQNDPHCEEYKNVFLKLRFNDHIPGQHYFAILDRYITKYKSDKDFRKKVNLYIELTEDLWKKPTNDIKFMKSECFIPKVERTEFGKKYYELENQLISIFKTI